MMDMQQTDVIRLNGINIVNYKGIDTFNFEFPRPTYNDDPDIVMIGGRNGIGKSAFLECCAFALMTPTFEKAGSAVRWDQLPKKIHPKISRLPDLLIKSGEESAKVVAELERNNVQFTVYITIDNTGIYFDKKPTATEKRLSEENTDTDEGVNLCNTICRVLGYSSGPVIDDWLLHFNSFRSVGFDSPNLENVTAFESNTMLTEASNTNLFKLTLLKLLFNHTNFVQKDGFNACNNYVPQEPLEEEYSSKALNYFRLILQQYANGKLLSVKELSDGSYDFRVKIGENNPISIDGLGSGHKEIISMLLLMWTYAKKSSKVILIDSPELHFNTELQQKFIQDSFAISNQNQFIYATHSKEVVKSVNIDRCIILRN